MNTKFAAIVLATSVAIGVPVAIAATMSVESLGYTSGVVNAVDVKKGTIVVDGKVYTAKPADLYQVQPGAEIEIWFDAKARAAAIEMKPMNQTGLLS